MKQLLRKALLSMILSGGLFIGMVRGQETKEKWIAKMKNKYEGNHTASQKNLQVSDEIMLDEFEISSFHS